MDPQENSKPNTSKTTIGFKYAWHGIRLFLKARGNARIHLFISLFVVAAGLLTGLSRNEWFWVILCIAVVVASEMFNTAIELLTDLVSPEYNKQAGKIKDLSAGAVLMVAIAAAITGTWIFLPKWIEIIAGSAAGGY